MCGRPPAVSRDGPDSAEITPTATPKSASRPPSPMSQLPHPFYDYKDERAHLNDALTFRAELNTASISTLNHRASVDALAGVSLIHPTSPKPSSISARGRGTSITSIASSGLRLNGIGMPLEKGIEAEWVDGHEKPHGDPVLDQDEENAEAIDDGFTGSGPMDQVTAELQALYSSFQRCIDLREKYMRLSRQRLEDNPANYDGSYSGTPGASSPLPLPSVTNPHVNITDSDSPRFKPWAIYPPPPSPHWKERDPYSEALETTEEIAEREKERRKFDWVRVEIPGKEKEGKQKGYGLDANGVYQVYNLGRHPHLAQTLELLLMFRPSFYSTHKTDDEAKTPLYEVPTIKEYFQDLDEILSVISDGPAKSFAWRRLKYLESKWNLYVLLNEYRELAEMKRVSHRDFYNVRKVDTHIHHSASMNQKHMLRFIKSKMKRCPDEIVIYRDEKYLTLRQVFDSLNLTAYDLSIDTLDMHAHRDSFHRFDKFNLKYNPLGESRLREIFLKTDNLVEGRYLAEITKEVITDLQASKYQMAEYRISIYGRNTDEWDKLAKWIVANELFSDNVRWLIQIPRLYNVFKESGGIECFEDIVHNIFSPLFEVTQDPTSHPELHIFLQRVVGFDSVDDESKAERRLYRKFPLPKEWNTKQNPPYNYWLYYLYSNMTSLNNYRHERGFNTFWLRPHAGEAGDTDHLTSAFLTSHSISHGILLRKVPALQYLFYLQQIGIAMSPLSNNALFLTYERNPLPNFFRTGLNVSLSTDDPLQFHFTKEPLLEEYSVAAQIYKFSPADMCELARNSCLQSGFEMEVKRHWLGPDWYRPGVPGNLIHKTNVPDLRVEYRHATLMEEREMVSKFSKPLAPISVPAKASLTLNLDSTSIGAAAMLASKKSALAIPGMHADGRKESVGGV